MSLYLMKNGRESYLNFLRNLTPQITMLLMAFLIGRKLNFEKFDLNNTLPTIIFYAFVTAWLLSVYCNSTLFIQNITENSSPIKAKGEEFTQAGIKGRRLFWSLVKYSLKNEKLFLCEVLVVLLIVEIGCCTSFVMAMFSFAQTLKLIHPA